MQGQQHKKAKSQDTRLRVTKTYAFCRKKQQAISGLGKSVAEVMYLFCEYTRKTNFEIHLTPN